MLRKFFILILAGAAFAIVPPIHPQQEMTGNQRSKGVPDEYAGNWVCQTSMPGYNIFPPDADQSQPQAGKMTTPPTVAILKLSLSTDATYQASNAKGHYSFDAATKSITWLDGPHQKTITKTQLGNRKDGAPKIGFILNKRYYGCFMPQVQRK